jgi:hypothetical protein
MQSIELFVNEIMPHYAGEASPTRSG